MRPRTRRTRGDTPLEGMLSALRNGMPVTAEVLADRGSRLVEAAGWDQDPVKAHRQFRSSLDQVAGIEGEALRAAMGTALGSADTLRERREAFVLFRAGIAVESCPDLEERAIDELALRLLGGHYPGASRPCAVPGNVLVRRQESTAIYRHASLVGRRHRFTVITLAPGAVLRYRAPAGTRLDGLVGVEVAAIEVEDDEAVFALRPVPARPGGRVIEFGFAEVLPRPGHLPPMNWRARDVVRTQYAVLDYTPRIEFDGESTDQVSLRRSGTARRKLVVEGKQVPAEILSRHRWRQTRHVGLTDLRPDTEIAMQWTWGLPALSSLAAVFGYAAAAAVDLPGIIGHESDASRNMLVAARVIFLFLALREVYAYYQRWHRLRFKAGHSSLSLRQIPIEAVDPLREKAADTRLCSNQQAILFSLGILHSRQLRQRLVETYQLDQRAVRQHVSIDIEVPRPLFAQRDREQTIYFPVLMPVKSKFQDDFSVHGPDGAALHVLPYRQYLQLAARVLRVLLVRAMGGTTAFDNSPAAKSAEREAIALIAARRTPDGDAPGIVLNPGWHKAIEIDADADPARDKALTEAREFVEMLSHHYAIVVPLRLDENGRALVKFEQTLIPELTLVRKKRLALLLGARPIDMSFSIRMASTCQSYHLRVVGTDGLYLGDQNLVDSAATLTHLAKHEQVPPHFRFRKRLGQPHAHVYARFFPEPARIGVDDRQRLERPSIRLKFFETPPGSLLRAVVSALACLALVWIVGVINTRVPDADTDAPAFLLVFPAVVGAWLGFDSAGRRLLEGTLAARLSLTATVLLSIVSTGLFLGHKGLQETHHWYLLPDGWSLLWIKDVSWLVVVLLALGNAFVTTALYLRRTAFYSYLATRSQGEGEVLAHG
ncbi:hypothetical protein [Actinokineospora terrae]|uniref:Uncharacterized protein n=1 Tax=Actinokineospora terrae TaxID=155974 RepID=A0A1H9QNF0_9PSEU|nr:hypothetical protein [Actinokineospora terrae]SER61984.1 hypothetical protein SAMN04487818_104367 [Actinokineospora terrae]